MRAYIAYGSNLDTMRMQHRCPGAYPIGTGLLRGWRLLFRGSKTGSYLTIERDPDAETPVALWSITPEDEENLDIYEGYPRFYYKAPIRVRYRDMDGLQQRVRAFAYIMHEDRPYGLPVAGYMSTCMEGYETFGFDPQYLWDAYDETKRRIALGNEERRRAL